MRTVFFFLFLLTCQSGFTQPQQEIKQQIDSLVYFIKNKATEAFAENTVYRGEDAKRKWKDVYDPTKPEEYRAAKQILVELKEALAGCNYKEFAVFQQKEKSEGVWYVYTYACGGSKRIMLAFLKIKGKYALGDIDVEDDDDPEN